jgi:hypothetical protein
MTDRFRRLALALLLAVTPLALGACSNPVEEEHEDHAVGLLFVDAQGQEVARVNIEASPDVTGQFTIAAGATQTLQVFALAEDGDRIEIDGEEFGLEVDPIAGGVATASVQGANRLVLTGNQAGATAVTVALLHEGHRDLERSVPVVVQ